MREERRELYLLYHFFHPDEVVSARLFSDLAQYSAIRGFDVIAAPSNRSCYDLEKSLPKNETWEKVSIRRIWRPSISQKNAIGRLANSLFMLAGWAWLALLRKRRKHEVVVVGTDPIFGVLITIAWRLLRPQAKIIHWCHDVHPEASIADGQAQHNSLFVVALKWLLRRAYRRCNVIVDLGSCMRAVLQEAAGTPGTGEGDWVTWNTITPWSLVEPMHVEPIHEPTRVELFGEVDLALLYSGNLGKAHDIAMFLDLARNLRDASIKFCFAGRGIGFEALKNQLVPEDSNIVLAGFANEKELALRLSCCDIHLVSLRESWLGTVVPSKFFGAIAIGRPVLFSGPEDCCIARHIQNHRLGWTLNHSKKGEVSNALRQFASKTEFRDKFFSRCHSAYQGNFSKRLQLEKWSSLIL